MRRLIFSDAVVFRKICPRKVCFIVLAPKINQHEIFVEVFFGTVSVLNRVFVIFNSLNDK